MHKYQIRFAGCGTGDPKIVEFESQDRAGALNVLATMDIGPRGELWEDDFFICTISKNAAGHGAWAVHPT